MAPSTLCVEGEALLVLVLVLVLVASLVEKERCFWRPDDGSFCCCCDDRCLPSSCLGADAVAPLFTAAANRVLISLYRA